MKGRLVFHVIASGTSLLELAGAPRRLRPGDLALVPHGRGHRLASGQGVAAPLIDDLPHNRVSARYKTLRYGGGGAPTALVCGAMRFDRPAAQLLVDALPEVIVVRASASRTTNWLDATLSFMDAEAREPRPGAETVITRLADILIIQAIRSWLEENPAAKTGWVGALRDAQVGRAIALVHKDPAREWTLSALAREAGMSRSAFAARFTRVVGEPPMRHVARWRMHAAVESLRDEGVAVGELAQRLGYRSEAAFSRAFKRHIGSPPGAIRRAGMARTERRPGSFSSPSPDFHGATDRARL